VSGLGGTEALAARIATAVTNNLGAELPFYLVLAGALAIVIAAELIQRQDVLKKYRSRNVRTDMLYAVLELSHLEALLLLGPVAAGLNGVIDQQIPWLRLEAIAQAPIWLKLAVAVVVTDFASYWLHRLKHVWPVLWQFHKVHHSQSELSVFTRFRFPLLDRLLDLVVLFPIGVIAGSATLPLALYLIVVLRSCLEHSGLNWTYGPLGWLIVSPSFHGTHHSNAPEHIDRNFAGAFAIWDHMFGTYARRGDGPLSYGLAHEAIPQGFLYGQVAPVHGLWKLARRRRDAGPTIKAETAA
jgi:sterol desaturase/sphingolipid hydroxylase (fatty acid hydroxylase superfamily)